MSSFVGEVHDEAFRYVYALGGASLLGTIGALGLLGAFAYCAGRLRFALGRWDVIQRSDASACARP
jgi:hypothetical protein